MPLFTYDCLQCGTINKRIVQLDQSDPAGMTCKACGKFKLIKAKQGGTSNQTMEVVDNGIQTRPVERLAEAERIFKEREQAHDQKYKIEEDPQE